MTPLDQSQTTIYRSKLEASMKSFIDIKPRVQTQEQPKVKSYEFIMEKLMLSCTKVGQVREAIWSWLMSLENPMSKKLFEDNMNRLAIKDEEAIEQLFNSHGYMKVRLPKPEKKPLLPADLLDIAVEKRRVAIGGPGIPKHISGLVQRLEGMKATYYVLDIEELIVQYVGTSSGNAHQMIKDAIDAEILIMVRFETCPMLQWVVKEAIKRIHHLRTQKNKITVSTWHRYNNVPDVFEDYCIYATTK